MFKSSIVEVSNSSREKRLLALVVEVDRDHWQALLPEERRRRMLGYVNELVDALDAEGAKR